MDEFQKNLENLISYINDIKPYHSKLIQVEEEFIMNDKSKLRIAENISIKIRVNGEVASEILI